MYYSALLSDMSILKVLQACVCEIHYGSASKRFPYAAKGYYQYFEKGWYFKRIITIHEID